MMRFFITIFFISTATLAQENGASGQEATNSPAAIEAEIEVTEGTEPNTEASNSTESPAGRDFDVFLPTEDISEDLAVPFPADI